MQGRHHGEQVNTKQDDNRYKPHEGRPQDESFTRQFHLISVWLKYNADGVCVGQENSSASNRLGVRGTAPRRTTKQKLLN